jgi:hypothetical protein
MVLKLAVASSRRGDRSDEANPETTAMQSNELKRGAPIWFRVFGIDVP